jgi:hypothetical protein
MRMILGCGVLLALALTSGIVTAKETVRLPRGYQSWEKSGDKVVNDKNSLFYGIHTIYVDRKAMPAYRRGSGYAEGSQFVVEFFAIREEHGKQVRGKKNMVVLMKRDRTQTATGGWLFAGFGADGTPSGLDPEKTCFGCHLRDAKERDYVISRFADFRQGTTGQK